MKICMYCGTEFVPKRIDSKYCSRECQVKGFHASRPKGVNKNCAWCGKEFFAEHKGIKYCSSLCKMKAADEQRIRSAEKNKVQREPIKCKACGVEFIPRDTRQLFCCQKCCGKYHREHKSTSKAISYKERKCAICGKTFSPTNSKQKYCSEECYKESLYRSHKKDTFSEIAESVKPKKVPAKSPASRRWEKMDLQERAIECNRHHISYGQAQVAAMNGTLPIDWGLCR